jgi:hypothetical protein
MKQPFNNVALRKLLRPIMASLIVMMSVLFIMDSIDSKEEEKNDLIVVIEGCEYIAVANGESCDTVHIDGCRNPLHWSHVLSDTSWYWRLREDTDR